MLAVSPVPQQSDRHGIEAPERNEHSGNAAVVESPSCLGALSVSIDAAAPSPQLPHVNSATTSATSPAADGRAGHAPTAALPATVPKHGSTDASMLALLRQYAAQVDQLTARVAELERQQT